MKSLEDLRDDRNPLEKPTYMELLKHDVKNGTFKEQHRIDKLTSPTAFQNAKKCFIDTLLKNIRSR